MIAKYYWNSVLSNKPNFLEICYRDTDDEECSRCSNVVVSHKNHKSPQVSLEWLKNVVLNNHEWSLMKAGVAFNF